MQTIYELLTKRSDLLENTVVIIDPCLNPDGRDRYANWYNQTTTIPYNTNKISMEHKEPWPGFLMFHRYFICIVRNSCGLIIPICIPISSVRV